MSGWLPYVTMTLLMLCGFLLIFIILLQRGRGGGLAGALGGAGGQSAFGTKAGDVFTKITIGLAVVWVLFAIINLYTMQSGSTKFKGGTDAVPTAPSLTDLPDSSGSSSATVPAETDDKATSDAATLPVKEDSKTEPASTPAESASEAKTPESENSEKTEKTPSEDSTPAADAKTPE